MEAWDKYDDIVDYEKLNCYIKDVKNVAEFKTEKYNQQETKTETQIQETKTETQMKKQKLKHNYKKQKMKMK